MVEYCFYLAKHSESSYFNTNSNEKDHPKSSFDPFDLIRYIT